MLELQLQQQAKTAVWNARSVLGIILLSLESRPFVRRPWRVASASSRTAHRPTIYVSRRTRDRRAGVRRCARPDHARMRRMRDSLRVPTAPRGHAASLLFAVPRLKYLTARQSSAGKAQLGGRPSSRCPGEQHANREHAMDKSARPTGGRQVAERDMYLPTALLTFGSIFVQSVLENGAIL
eukprot:COSAG02_NODE_211_length_28730_cov_5.599490_20_plen_181_part_00